MNRLPDDICPQPRELPPQPTRPAAAPIYLTSVWQCDSTQQARQLLEGELPGFVYQRDGHPNAVMLAEKCAQLHGAQRAAITSSGMSALVLALLSQLQQGDHALVSRDMYGRSLTLLDQEAARLGIATTLANTCDLDAVAAAMTAQTKLLVVETIANPLLQVADITELAQIAHGNDALLLVDNTFATPALCRPLELGADLVLESISKMMNGHSDVMLGLLCGSESHWQRVPLVLSAWGLASGPLECYLAARGLATMHLRVDRACSNALDAAQFLASRDEVERVNYPGLPNHSQHELSQRQFEGRYGSVVTFHLAGGQPSADAFIASARKIPFCPSLGEVSTTLSHPRSTSHRSLTPQQCSELGITDGAIRLSVGIESSQFVLDALAEGLAGVTASGR